MDVVTTLFAVLVLFVAILALLSARRNARQVQSGPIPNRVLLQADRRTAPPADSRPLESSEAPRSVL